MARVSSWQSPANRTVTPSGRLLRVCARTAALVWVVGAAPVAADTTLTSVFHPPSMCVESGGGGLPVGAKAWNSPANALTADNVRADSNLGGGESSRYLRCTGFGFTIPAGSVIDGLEMQTEHRHPQAVDKIGDLHVYPVRSDGAAIGSVGTDQQKPCATNDWGSGAADSTATYGGAADKWGITWDACPAAQTACPSGGFNVNHPNFGVAVAATNCGGTAAFAQVDSVALRATYTIPACGTQAWGTPTVTVANRTPGAVTTYTIVTTVPNRGGCALTSGSQITIAFQPDTITGGITAAGSSFKATSAATATPINPVNDGAQGVTFAVPAAALRPCEGQAQGCLEAGTSVTIVLNGVRNPTADNNYTLNISATPTLDGVTGTTTSSPFTIATDCTAASAWGIPQVMLSDPQASLAASGTTLGCPIFAKYTVTTSVPAPGGCRLVGGTSKLLLQFPAGTDADAVRITDAKVNMTSVTAEATGDVTLVRLPVPMDVANGMAVNIELTVVQNPTLSSATNTVSVRATAPFFSSTGSTGTTSSAPYTIAAHTACPPIDFYVRDWTHKPSNTRDDGNIPSSPNSMGETIPPGCWAECTDVWNQGGPIAPAIPDDDYFVGTDPGLSGSNNAFTRITRKSAAPAIPTYRPVTATYFFSAYGLGTNFQPLGSVTTQNVSSSNPTTILAPLTSWTIPDVPGQPPGTKPGVGKHVCIAVQIDSASDPQKNAGITTSDIPGPADPKIWGDDNKALRNMEVINMAMPPPPPPPPAPPMGPGGPMALWGIAHNADVRTRDMVIRYDVPQDVLRHLREPKIDVIGGESPTVRPGSTFTLARMRPGENRWIGFNYTLASGADQLLPVSFTEVDGEKILGAFTFGIQASPMDTVIRRNLEMHSTVFARMARVFSIPQGKDESAAADALLKEYTIPDERYVGHLQRHRGAIEEAVIRLIRAEKSNDPFGLAAALKSFAESLGAGSAAHAANGHLALLERLDAFETMLDMAKGDPADVRQMVWWQKELYTTVPQLKALGVSASVVKESDQFIAGYAKAKPSAYAEHVARLAKSFRATADALKKEGVDVTAEAAQLQRPSKSIAAVQKAHRDYLLKLDDLAVAGGYSQQPQQQQQQKR